MIIDEYLLHLDTPVGSGAHGLVVDAMNIRTSKRYIAKRIEITSPRGQSTFETERNHLLKLANCQHIIKLVKVIHHKQYGYLIMERMDTDLMYLIESCSLTMEQRAKIFYQLTLGLSECHAHGIAHLDIKPDNVLVNTDTFEVKLCDFGMSRSFETKEITIDAAGTVPYIAPELCNNSRGNIDARKADVWSLAILYHVLLSDFWPFACGAEDLLPAVRKGDVYFHQNLSPVQRNLLVAMTCMDPSKRLSVDQVLERLTVNQRPQKLSHARRVMSFLRSKGLSGKRHLHRLSVSQDSFTKK